METTYIEMTTIIEPCGKLAVTRRADVEAYEEYGRTMYFMAKAVRPILGMVPPDPTSLDPRDLKRLADLGSHFLDLGDELFPTFIKLMTMSSADFLDEWFETEPLKATMSASGIIGTFMGPRSPGTAYVLLHHYMGEIDCVYRAWGFAKRGEQAVWRKRLPDQLGHSEQRSAPMLRWRR